MLATLLSVAGLRYKWSYVWYRVTAREVCNLTRVLLSLMLLKGHRVPRCCQYPYAREHPIFLELLYDLCGQAMVGKLRIFEDMCNCYMQLLSSRTTNTNPASWLSCFLPYSRRGIDQKPGNSTGSQSLRTCFRLHQSIMASHTTQHHSHCSPMA